MSATAEKLEALRAMIEAQQIKRITDQGWSLDVHPHKVRIKMGRKYANVDVSGPHWSGAYMVELATGEIFGIKAYGVIHRGHRYGNLDTISEWNWSDYRAIPKAARAA